MRTTMTMIFRWMGGLAMLAWSATVPLEGRATPVIATDDFETGYSGWQAAGPDGEYQFSHPPAGGNGGAFLQLYFPELATPGQQIGYFYNTDTNHVGDYSGLAVNFDFYVAPVSAPAVGLNFYFVSGASTWYHEFTVPANQWTSVNIDFSGANWYGGTDFMADVQTISEIGIQVHHFTANGSSYTYGLDNWGFQVPEPETDALLFVVLISLAITFRGPLLTFLQRGRIRLPTA